MELGEKLSGFSVFENGHRIHRTLHEWKSSGTLMEAEEGSSKILNKSG